MQVISHRRITHKAPPKRWDARGIAGWDGTVAGGRALQSALAGRVTLKDGFRKQLRTVAGMDIGFEQAGTVTRAAAVLLDAETLQLLDQRVLRVATHMPYVPGLLSFRELPALLEVLTMLQATPDLVLIDGQGIAHPRRFGIAAHFGLASGLPTIGVAKTILIGRGPTPHQIRGAYTPLRHKDAQLDKDVQLGWLLRSKLNCNPLVVSPGHRVAMASAADLVMRCVTRYRLPEPTRLADRMASRRDRTRG